jgi:SET domain-containing protein
MASELPHEKAYVRLGLSDVHGIGVFAIKPIPEGTALFADDPAPIRWVAIEELEQAGLSPAERRLYEDFGIRQNGRIGCPPSFDNLTPAWYLNEPPAGVAANVRSDADFAFFTSRDIAEGEELLIDYASFSEPPG